MSPSTLTTKTSVEEPERIRLSEPASKIPFAIWITLNWPELWIIVA
jgi:hypothetical protein